MGLMQKISKFYKSSLFIFIAAILTFSTLAPLAKVFADSADPVPAATTGGVVFNSNGSITVTVQGGWVWTTHHSDCNLDRFGVGWAVDWHDPSAPGNLVGDVNGLHAYVGTPSDNTVHYAASAPYCGTYDSTLKYNSGLWGPISHTYPAGTTTLLACVVTYDIHAKDGGPDPDHLIAGGTDRNKDNSVEENKNTPLGNGCFGETLQNILVVKHVINDSGGSNKSAGDFTMHVAATSPSQNDFGGSETGTLVQVGTGPYSVDELSHDGYTKTIGTGCSGTIAAGETKICVITNDDIPPTPPHLTLSKHVINNNGGNANASAWTLAATGSGGFSGTGTPATGTDASIGQNVTAGVQYTLGESGGPNGYGSTGIWSCTGGGTFASPDKITLANGENATCTITNDDISPQLTVTKIVNNNPYGPTAPVSSFPLFVTDTSNNSKTQVASGITYQFNAGSYAVSETQQPGYTLTSGVCDGQNTLSLTLNVGDNKSCTLTNTAIQPKLIVKKHVINNSGRNKQANEFTMNVTANNPSLTSFPGNEAGTTVTLNEGSYSVDESPVDHYTKTLSDDCSGTISIGETKTCTITNDDIAPINAFHGIAFAKGCNSPTDIGAPDECGYLITNFVDTAHDTLTFDSLVDVVHSANGDVTSPNILSQVNLISTGGATCSGPSLSGNGTAATPYHGATLCTLPFGSTLEVLPYSHYNVTADDYDLPGHNLPDTATLTWSDTCDGPSENCSQGDLQIMAESSTLILAHPAINVVKSGPSSASAGSTVTYTFTVTNTGDIPLSGVTVDDNVAGMGTYQSGDVHNTGFLDTDETWIYTAQYTIPAGQTASVNNTVTACGEFVNQEQEVNIESFDEAIVAHEVCDTDTHTLVIPKVLAETTTTPPPAVLVNTGENALVSIFAGLTILGLVGATSYASRPRKN